MGELSRDSKKQSCQVPCLRKHGKLADKTQTISIVSPSADSANPIFEDLS